MPTIARVHSKTKGVRYKAVIKKNGAILKTKTFSTLTNAKAWAKRIEADSEAMEALDSPAASLTFKQLAGEYLAQWSGKNTSVPNHVAWWVERIGSRKLTDINARLIRKYLDEYGAGTVRRYNGCAVGGRPKFKTTGKPRSPATFNRMRALISAVFKFAFNHQYLAANPVRSIPSRTESKGRVRWLSEDERKALLAACEASEWPKLHLLVMPGDQLGCAAGGASAAALVRYRFQRAHRHARDQQEWRTTGADLPHAGH